MTLAHPRLTLRGHPELTLALHTNLKASKLFPEPSQSIRRERDKGTSAVASLNQSCGPATASLKSSVALLAIRLRLAGLVAA